MTTSSFATPDELRRRKLPVGGETVKDFTVYVRNALEKEWSERYQVATPDPEKYGRHLIKWFNSTLRPHESRRTFVRVEIHGDVVPPEHRWVKQTIMTQSRHGRPYDPMHCERCNITGKRYGLSSAVKRDSKFRAKVYARCDTAMLHLAKSGDTT